MDDEIRAKALQKGDHQLRGVSAGRCQNEERDAHDEGDEFLEIALFFGGQPQIARLGDFRVVVDKADARETDEGKERKQNERIRKIGPKQRRYGSRNNNQYAAHCGGARLFLVLLRALFPDKLADLQFAEAADQRWAGDQRQKHGREARIHRAHGDVTKNIQGAEVALKYVVKEVVEHLSAVPPGS